MQFLFRPLDAGAVKLRGEAFRLAKSLRDARGVSNRIRDSYIMRAVGDGRTVTVTVIPLVASLGGVTNGFVRTGQFYPNSSELESRHVVYSAISDPALQGKVLYGASTPSIDPAGRARSYIASGRAKVGSVSQEWPLTTIGTDQEGYIRSLPDYLVEGQCREGQSGAAWKRPWATRSVPCRTALLTLQALLYRESYYNGMDDFPTNPNFALALCRLNASTPMLNWDSLPPEYPPAIKHDIQADYRPCTKKGRGRGLIEISTEALGIDGTIIDTPVNSTEGSLRPLGCFEWDHDNGFVAVAFFTRDYSQRMSFMRYTMTDSDKGESVWRVSETPASIGASELEVCTVGGAWATRAGRGLSNGEPNQPDTIILLTYDWVGEWLYTTRLWRIDPISGSRSSVIISQMDYNQDNLAGPLLEYQYSHALGVTVGDGESAEPLLVCARRTIPYWIWDLGNRVVRASIPNDSTGKDETHMVSVNKNGGIVVLDTGSNFPAYFTPTTEADQSLGDGQWRREHFLCWQLNDYLPGLPGYDAPVCEFAPGYVAILVAPRARFLSAEWPIRLVICNVVTGAKVYESDTLPFGNAPVVRGSGISCVKHGTVVDGVASGGILMISMDSVELSQYPNAPRGVWVTRDLGVTLERVLDGNKQVGTYYYLGTPLLPNPIGGGA